MKKQWKWWLERSSFLRGAVGAACLCVVTSAGADAFDEYQTNGLVYEYDLPTISAGWMTALSGFPAGSPVVGAYDLSGRLLAANNQTLYLQLNYGSDVWVPVATIGSGWMDPSFLKISSDGSTIALGVGAGKPLLVFPSSILSVSAPPNLTGHGSVESYLVDYYDGDFYGPTHLVLNGGWVIGGVWGSGIYALERGTSTITPLIENIPGASAGISVDGSGNVFSGIGYLTSPNRTGEIKGWSALDVSDVIFFGSPSLDYDTTGSLIADNVLSAGALGFDGEGNLHVGGGDAFGVGGPSENGYAALIHADVVSDVLSGLRGPVSEASTTEYTELVPDPCQDDSATSPISYVGGTEALAIVWNPQGKPSSTPPGACYPAGSAQDYWMTGVTPRVTLYFPDNAPDSDGDGIPDGADNAYLTANPDQRDTDGDGWANIADADFNNDGIVNTADVAIWSAANGSSIGGPSYNPHADMNGDGFVNIADYTLLLGRWLDSPPFY